MNGMIPAATQEQIKKAYGQLLARSGGRRRHGQQRMIAEIARAVANAKGPKDDASKATGARMLAVDAPTGAGKTYGYGLGAIPTALAQGLKVIISTGTVSLQEQLVSRDLVALAAVLPEMKATLIKGRGRYACPVRMVAAMQDRQDAPAYALAEELLPKLESGAWSGDIDDLQEQPNAAAWASLTNDRAGCTGRKCAKFDACPFYKARQGMDRANVYVVNHSLLIADTMQGGGLLPKPEDSVLVIDEAHHLPDKTLGALAGSHALDDAQRWVGRCQKVLSHVRSADRAGLVEKKARLALGAVQIMSGVLSEAKARLAAFAAATPRRKDCHDPIRFESGRLPAWLARLADDCYSAAKTAHDALADVSATMLGDGSDGFLDAERDTLAAEVGAALLRIERIVALWRLMRADRIDGAPVAKWIETSPDHDDLHLCASPIGVGQYLHDVLWSKIAATVHLSGTMTSTDGFDSYLRDSGLSLTPGVRTLQVDSPFDHARQASLIVPAGLANPKDAEQHTNDLIRLLPQALAMLEPGQGALVIFPSWSQLRKVADAMPEWVKEVMVRQDILSKREALHRHMNAVGEGKVSVLFGSQSIEEGVDLKGDLCRMVILAKLPFMVPTDPIAATLKEHFESIGRDHFTEVVVTHAFRRLAQTAGRLLRTEADTGNIIVADTRLTGTRYGRRMLASLPPYRLCSALSQAQQA